MSTQQTHDEPLLLIATQTFVVTNRYGHDQWITAGEIAHPDSWAVKHYPTAFQPLEIQWPAHRKRGEALNGESPAAVSPAALKRRGGRGRRADIS
jgi:hypothetical protein